MASSVKQHVSKSLRSSLHFNIADKKKKKNRMGLIRERHEWRREIRNPIQLRALVHCKCGIGHSQFQKEQVLYIRVWRDGRPLLLSIIKGLCQSRATCDQHGPCGNPHSTELSYWRSIRKIPVEHAHQGLTLIIIYKPGGIASLSLLWQTV